VKPPSAEDSYCSLGEAGDREICRRGPGAARSAEPLRRFERIGEVRCYSRLHQGRAGRDRGGPAARRRASRPGVVGRVAHGARRHAGGTVAVREPVAASVGARYRDDRRRGAGRAHRVGGRRKMRRRDRLRECGLRRLLLYPLSYGAFAKQVSALSIWPFPFGRILA
jgi:hypothetical protein